MTVGAPESAVTEFFSECDEILQRFSSKLSEAESSGTTNASVTGSLYRDMHTLKGSSQLFGFKILAQIAHAIEAALEPIRSHKLQIPPQLMDALFDAVSVMEQVVKASVGQSSEPEGVFIADAQWIVSRLIEAVLSELGGGAIADTGAGPFFE